jgi:hypothetical protein
MYLGRYGVSVLRLITHAPVRYSGNGNDLRPMSTVPVLLLSSTYQNTVPQAQQAEVSCSELVVDD